MRLVFGGLVAVILLGLYGYAVVRAISLALACASATGCSPETVARFTAGFAGTMTTVGGLVSALVIAELAITRPGEVPMARIVGGTLSAGAVTNLKVVTGAYLLAWLALGLSAYVVGVMRHPGTLQPLTDLGQSWLGLAVAAAYSYFGIDQTNVGPARKASRVRSGAADVRTRDDDRDAEV